MNLQQDIPKIMGQIELATAAVWQVGVLPEVIA